MTFTMKEIKEELHKGLGQYLMRDPEGNYVIPVCQQMPFYLIGPAGIGKTEIARQVAEEAGIGFVSVSMTHHTRQSALGLPEIKSMMIEDREYKYTCYTMSEIIAAVYKEIENGHKEGILLLDEFNCVSDTLFPNALAFLQTKVFGNTKLPDGWMIILCGNPPKSVYNKFAKEFDGAIMDRLRVMEIEVDGDVFLEYAEKKKMHQVIRAFLHLNKHYIYRCRKEGKKMELVTCRTWECLSTAISSYEKLGYPVTEYLVAQFLKSDEIAEAFYHFYLSGNQSFDSEQLVKEILEDRVSHQNMRLLKKVDRSLLFAVTQNCFQELVAESGEALMVHRLLKNMRNSIKQGTKEAWEEFLRGLTEEERKLAEMEAVWQTGVGELFSETEEMDYGMLKKLHNQMLDQQKKKNDGIIAGLEHMLALLSALGQDILRDFYLREAENTGEILYVMSNTEHHLGELEKQNEDLQDIIDEIGNGDEAYAG